MSNYTVVPGNADGKILTSTLWQQSGRIVINGQELSGYIYNRYCPYLSPESRIRSVTGCTNTADAQILYYYLEKGFSLDLSVSTEDYFSLNSNRKKIYYLSETSSVGEGTVSAINDILSNTENFATGDFIAALNFYCGVKNHSFYGESTGTSVYLGTFYDGIQNLKVYRAAGFDSYFSVGTTNELFFDTSGKNYQLTDLAYSIIRENLDYGEPVRVDIPGHSIYLDGYKWNEETGEYEYHLNYGWGVNSPSTKWYTVSEIYDVSFDTLGLDLSPDIRVTVSNERNDYYGGSFLRGVERINHIQNDKATTFAFIEELTGENIVLDYVEFTSSVDLEFINWNIYLCVSGKDALTSDNALIFSEQSGGIIVNSAVGNSCIVGAADESLIANLTGGYYFAGNTDMGFSAIQSAMSNFWECSDSLRECINSCAVIAGSADDIITLKSGAVIVGDIDFGTGKNQFNIESGSAFFGTVSGSAGSVELTLSASDIENRTMIYLTGDEDDFLTATGGNLNFILQNETDGAVFQLIEFQSGSISETFFNDFSVTVKFAGEEYVLNLSDNVENNFNLLLKDNVLTLLCNNDAPVISVVLSETGWTNEDVVVHASFLLEGENIAGEYSIDGGETWSLFDSSLNISQNCVLMLRAMGKEEYTFREITINNIDKIAPLISDISAVFSDNNRKATVSAVFSDDVGLVSCQYKNGINGQYMDYNDAFDVRENTTIFFRVVDHAGNVTESFIEINGIESAGLVDCDIDGNGIADILMCQNSIFNIMKSNSGVWLLSEDSQAKWGNLSQLDRLKTIFGTGRTVEGKAQSDVYILNTKNNSIGAWITDENGEIIRWQNIATFDSSTEILAIGDFNGDGISDILLQNSNGAVGCSFINGDKSSWNYFQSLGKEWEISATGDFNGDGIDDIVLRHDAGFAGCWLTQGDGSVIWSNLDTLSATFEIVGSGDFNGDGIDDILLKKDNYYGAWIVENGNAVDWMGLGKSSGTVEQISDFDGDGIDDLRIRANDGDLGVLLVKGEDNLQWRYFGSVGKEWNTSLASLM